MHDEQIRVNQPNHIFRNSSEYTTDVTNRFFLSKQFMKIHLQQDH